MRPPGGSSGRRRGRRISNWSRWPLTACLNPGKDPSYGALFFAEIREVGARPGDSEIEENGLFDEFPEAMTYPHIQPKLMEQVRAWLDEGNFHSEEEDIFELLV